ncbi:MAG: DegT/DnrJ/EryC1/StrS family aminotransferase [bacterium]|nr:DegT/DnrJ/EryC1/StrS family aminotransferase [bacterium]
MDAAIAGILESCAFVNSKSFEKDFATYLDLKNVVGVGNGTDALCMAVHCLGIGPGDEVICPANTFIATAEGIGWAGATPVFVDCGGLLQPRPDEDRGGHHAAHARGRRGCTPHGQPADMDPIVKIAKDHGLLLIEDCAQSHAATYKRARRPARSATSRASASTPQEPGRLR